MKPLVLLVDDIPKNLQLLDKALSSFGVDRIHAHCGQEAIKKAAVREPAVILMDVQMPDMDGFETARRIRELEGLSHVPIIFITATETAQEKIYSGYEAGAVDYLLKPVDLITLQAKVQVFLKLFNQRSLIEEQSHELARISQNLEEQVKERTRDLLHSNMELKQFVRLAAHDLQSPLRSISGYARCLELEFGSTLGKDAVDYISLIINGVKEMSGLLKDLLTYSSIEPGTRRFKSESLSEILETSLEILNSSIRESDAEISYTELPTVECDKFQMSLLFQHLLANAIKFKSSSVPIITLNAKKESEEWIVEVCDNGIGFDGEHNERVFEIFQRLHAGDEYPGTGIGLAICSQIIKLHGGRIWVDSQKGEGS
ncbi:response regulator, partial [bacterium]|nr:response regulator [bacterium]